jgi:2-amino-4-hydroxy-6-hydroxymethyldihydropteridine diphosphokinase
MAIIALGSNVHAEAYLPLAVKALTGLGRVRQVSTAYENPAFGPPGQPDYINAAVWLETDGSPDGLRDRLQEIERELGRVRSDDRYAPRTVDLDLCLWNGRVDDRPDHPLPDPDLLKRACLAVTVAELLPDLVHPVTGETMRAIGDRLAPGADLRPRHKITAAMRRASEGSPA